jgi:UDP-N-acetylglucosamine--N-acetylmuramyl-(pentapeptide) pyrophosphoryl-undecaprenol N-acetylglucosamine transferase
VDAGAAAVLEEANLTANSLAETVASLFADRGRLEKMGQAAKELAHPNAAQDVAKMAAGLVKM